MGLNFSPCVDSEVVTIENDDILTRRLLVAIVKFSKVYVEVVHLSICSYAP